MYVLKIDCLIYVLDFFRIWIRPEDRDTAVEEGNRLKTEIDNLHPMQWTCSYKKKRQNDEEEVEVNLAIVLHFVIFFSMIDGGFLSYLTENTTHQRCPFCHMLPREFILVLDGKFNVHEVALSCCCLSTLHCGLRFGDHLLKIGFSQDFKEARVNKSQKDCPIHTNDAQCNKCLYDSRKLIIQQRCIDEKNGLRVCFPKSNGAGNSNTGFTMR